MLQVIPTFSGNVVPYSPANTFGQFVTGARGMQEVIQNSLQNENLRMQTDKLRTLLPYMTAEEKMKLEEYVDPAAAATRKGKVLADAEAMGMSLPGGYDPYAFNSVIADTTGAGALNRSLGGLGAGVASDAGGDAQDFADRIAEQIQEAQDSQDAAGEGGPPDAAQALASASLPPAPQGADSISKAIQQSASATTPPPSVAALPAPTPIDLGGGYAYNPGLAAEKKLALNRSIAEATQRGKMQLEALKQSGRLAIKKAGSGKEPTPHTPDVWNVNGKPVVLPKGTIPPSGATPWNVDKKVIGPDQNGEYWQHGPDGEWSKVEGPQGVDKNVVAQEKELNDRMKFVGLGIPILATMDDNDPAKQAYANVLGQSLLRAGDLMAGKDGKSVIPDTITLSDGQVISVKDNPGILFTPQVKKEVEKAPWYQRLWQALTPGLRSSEGGTTYTPPSESAATGSMTTPQKLDLNKVDRDRLENPKTPPRITVHPSIQAALKDPQKQALFVDVAARRKAGQLSDDEAIAELKNAGIIP